MIHTGAPKYLLCYPQHRGQVNRIDMSRTGPQANQAQNTRTAAQIYDSGAWADAAANRAGVEGHSPSVADIAQVLTQRDSRHYGLIELLPWSLWVEAAPPIVKLPTCPYCLREGVEYVFRTCCSALTLVCGSIVSVILMASPRTVIENSSLPDVVVEMNRLWAQHRHTRSRAKTLPRDPSKGANRDRCICPNHSEKAD